MTTLLASLATKLRNVALRYVRENPAITTSNAYLMLCYGNDC